MTNCKNCGKPVESVQGRRQREFCDNKQYCRNQWHNKNKKPKNNIVLIPDENGQWITPDGKKCSLVWEDSNSVLDFKDAVSDGSKLTVTTSKKEKATLIQNTTEPKENTMAFFNKYGVMTKDELKSKK